MAHTDDLMINGVLTPVTMLDSSAQEIDDAAKKGKYFSNPNLIDNWYFADPIDQRGGLVCPPDMAYYDTWGGSVTGRTDKYYTAIHTPGGYDDQYQIVVNGAVKYIPISHCVRGYESAGYTIDRWYNNHPHGVVTITDKGVTLGAMKWLIQKFENNFIGKTLTASVLFADGEFCYGTVVYNGGDGRFCVSNGNAVYVEIVDNGGASKPEFRLVNYGETAERTIVAVKLELGSVQTLAHQDANGNWVLNDPPPNKQQELAKCQRYYLPIGSSTFGNIVSAINFGNIVVTVLSISTPVTMRATPVITDVAAFGTLYDNVGALHPITNLGVDSVFSNGVRCFWGNNGLVTTFVGAIDGMMFAFSADL